MYRDSLKEQNEYFGKLAERFELDFIDFNFETLQGFDRSIEGYVDYEGHMSGETAEAFSERLGEYLRE